MPISQLVSKPINVGGGGLYPYSKSIIDACRREARYPDMDGNYEFSLCRVIGTEFQKRILVPRNMVRDAQIDLRSDGKDEKFESSFKPRNSEQLRCGSEIVKLLKEGKNFVFEAPTGFGKTWVVTDVISKIGKKTIIIVTKEDILDQWVFALETLLGLSRANDIGFIKADRHDVVSKKVVIATVQSIAKYGRYSSSLFDLFGLAIWDECHRIGADFFSQSCFMIPAKLRLGVSATPDRKDGREEVIQAHIGETLVSTKATPMTPRVIARKSPWVIPTVPVKDDEGRVVMDAKGNVMRKPVDHSPGKCGHIIRMLSHHHGRNRMIVSFVLQSFQAGRKILIQSDRKDHLETLSRLIATAGVPPQQITFYVGGLTAAQREKAKAGSVIMATYQMTAEATDIPELDTLVMATPKSDVRQIVGRVIRFLEGKKEPIVFDLVDDTSPVFESYFNTRSKWYASVGAKVSLVKD